MHFFTRHKTHIKYLVLAGIAVLFFVLASAADAQYQPLTGLPGVSTSNPDLASYIQQLFLISISLGAMLAVVKISLAGFSYMMSDIITKKEQAKEDIKGALLGLGILIASVTILTVINPDLTKFKIFENAEDVTIADGGAGNGAGDEGSEVPTTCGDGEVLTRTPSGTKCAPAGEGGEGGTSACPSGYKETWGVQIAVCTGSANGQCPAGYVPPGLCESVPGSRNYYSCEPKTACPAGTKLKKTAGTCTAECKPIVSGDILWMEVMVASSQIEAKRTKCTSDGGILDVYSPPGETDFDVTCKKR